VDRSSDASPQAYRRHLREGVKILFHSLPRTMVVLIPIGDITQVLGQPDLPPECRAAHWFVCPCWTTEQGRAEIPRLVAEYRGELQALAADTKFSRWDFTVEVAPTTAGLLPTLGGRVRPGLLSPDCLHLSREANSIFGRNLWNNLVQPWASKAVDYRVEAPLLCPPQDRPFLSTQLNS